MSIPTPPPFITALAACLSPDRVSLRNEDRETYSHDLWPRFLLRVAGGQDRAESPPAQAIVWPQNAAEVQAVIKLCAKERVPLVPYGAGSGVAGGAAPPAGSVVLDTKCMRNVEIDAARQVVTFEPGILGWHLEEKLNRAGLTLGHFPSSIMCSTAGGWLATRGAGQMSTKYGKIEDMVRSLELVTGQGERLHCLNGDDGGADWVQLILGSEGTLGVITRATCAVRPMPAGRCLRGFSFPTLESALRAIKHLLALGLRPAVVRLYDELDTLISGLGRTRQAKSRLTEPPIARDYFDELIKLLRPDARRLKGHLERWLVRTLLGETEPLSRLIGRLIERFGQGSLLILGFEGEPRIAAAEDAYARAELARYGGRDLGEEPGQHWLRRRYAVSFKMSRAFMAGAFTDTIEVASTWDRLLPLYQAVRAAVAPYALCMAHFSHAYSDGCSIYFTVVGRRSAGPTLSAAENRAAVAEDEARYDALWQAAMQATLRHGGTISHHHGIGRLKAPYMPGEHGRSLRLFAALRHACDPEHIANPGALVTAADLDPAKNGQFSYTSSQKFEIDSANLLVEANATLTLFELEHALRQQRLSLGGLPPRAFLRTLHEALCFPRPSEASFEMGRLRDRSARLCAVLCDGTELRVPPQLAPRRATGPDLGQALRGQRTQVAELRAATLRLLTQPALAEWTGFFFASPEAAAEALFVSRALHGATGIAEMLITSRALLARVLETEAALPSGAWALLVRAAGPEKVATETLRELGTRLAAQATGQLSSAQCRAFWNPEAVYGQTATPESVAAFAAKFPPHERALGLAESTAEEVAAILAAAGDACLLAGIYLHGMTLCTDAPAAAAEKPQAGDAEAVLWPRFVDALFAQGK